MFKSLLSLVFIIFGTLFSISATASNFSCRGALTIFDATASIGSNFADRLSVHGEAELEISVARSVMVLPKESVSRILSLGNRKFTDQAFQQEVKSFAGFLLKSDNPEASVADREPLQVLSDLEAAFRSKGDDITRASISAITLYHLLRNLPEAGKKFDQFIWRMRPELRTTSEFSKQIYHLEQTSELSGVISVLLALGSAYHFAGTGGGFTNFFLFSAVAWGTGHLSHWILQSIPYREIAAPFAKLRQRLLKRSLQRTLSQFVTEQTDSDRARIFAFRFNKWREKIAQNRQDKKGHLRNSSNVMESAFLLTHDFPLLTLPFKLEQSDFKKLSVKEYQVLTQKFSDILQVRRAYLAEVVEVLREAESSTENDSLRLSDRNGENIQTLNDLGVKKLIQGIEIAEETLQQTLQKMMVGSQQLQILIDGLQKADLQIEQLMFGEIANGERTGEGAADGPTVKN
jgi:hypothetical protein